MAKARKASSICDPAAKHAPAIGEASREHNFVTTQTSEQRVAVQAISPGNNPRKQELSCPLLSPVKRSPKLQKGTNYSLTYNNQ